MVMGTFLHFQDHLRDIENTTKTQSKSHSFRSGWVPSPPLPPPRTDVVNTELIHLVFMIIAALLKNHIVGNLSVLAFIRSSYAEEASSNKSQAVFICFFYWFFFLLLLMARHCWKSSSQNDLLVSTHGKLISAFLCWWADKTRGRRSLTIRFLLFKNNSKLKTKYNLIM